ncbi:hypothetical protein NL533_35695, partial [Klebsiella pneumoniae]|nr:hypothetical protein [Klebsiella pneumoniae]
IRKADDQPCPNPEEVLKSIDKVANANGLARLGDKPPQEKANSGENIWWVEYSGNKVKMLCRVDEHGSALFWVIGMPSG